MYLKFPCTSCGKTLKVSEEYFGQKARCPHCKNTVSIPLPETESKSPDDPVVDWDKIVATSPAGTGPTTSSGLAGGKDGGRKSASPASRSEAPSSGGRFTGGTEVSSLWSGLIGLAISLVVFAILFPFRQYYLAAVIVDRGWVPYAETILFCWAMTFLVMKVFKIRQQRDSMLYDLLPTEVGEHITGENVRLFIAHVREIAKESANSILVNRVLRGLEHFRFRQSNSEVASILASQSSIDGNAAASSYSIVKVCNWAIPILGFIGTVLGIGNAVAGLGGGDMAGADLSALKQQLGAITSGLGVAFDTTLVALVMSIIISFPTSALQKNEDDLLNEVDDYCNENLLLRLKEPGSDDPKASGDTGQLLASALATQRSIVKMTDENLRQIVEQLNRSVSAMVERSEAAHRALATSFQHSSLSMKEQVAGLEKGLASLNEVLGKLGQERVVVEMHSPAKRGWSFFRRSNGVNDGG
jgi:biopolymer transport protein ExbB/TolQ/phage FluMu protein Com